MAVDSRYRSLFFICVALVCGLLLFLLTAHSPLNAPSSPFLYALQAQSNDHKPNLANSPEAAAIVPSEPSNALAVGGGGGKRAAEEEEVKAPLRVILTAFVGRRDRTGMLLAYADELIKRGYVDEVHMWDFAKDPVDRTWLRTFNGTLLATPDRHTYHHHMDVDTHCGAETMGRSFVFTVSAANDVMIKMDFDGNVNFELVIGGHKNEMSVFRQLGRPDEFDWTNLEMFLPNGDAGFTNFHLYFNASHGIVRIIDGAEHERMKLGEVAGEFDSFQHCKTRTCWTFPLQAEARYRRWKGVSFSTGIGAAFGYWKLDRLCTAQLASSTRYRVGYPKPTSRTPSYWQEYYRHYHHWRRSLYANTVLVKADDDTVFIDVDKFPAYIRYRLENPEPFLLFPNVINNGVAAWMQQTRQKVLPESAAGVMEYPMGEGRPGYCGSLWASSEKAYKLHSYFLSNTSHFSHPDSNVSYDIEPKLRFSINFFAVHTNHFDKFLHMWLEWDDELSITVTIPMWYNAHKALYPHFVVSHMAFGPQHHHTPQLLEGYNKLLVDKKEEWKRMEREMQQKGETLYPPLPKQFDYHTLAPNKPCAKKNTYSTAAAQPNTKTTQVTRGKLSAADMKKLRGEY